MRSLGWISLFSISFMASAQPVSAQATEQQKNDAICFRLAVASNAKMANNPSNPMALMAMYYLGRLNQSGASIKPLLLETSKDQSMENSELVKIKGRQCIAEWQAQVLQSKAAFEQLMPEK